MDRLFLFPGTSIIEMRFGVEIFMGSKTWEVEWKRIGFAPSCMMGGAVTYVRTISLYWWLCVPT